ncbi:MAG: transposase [Clostridia bacterium]|nr:transposase [Clostridia bacterium]
MLNDVLNTAVGGISAGRDIYIVTGHTDMRKSIDGLAAFIKGSLGMDPFAKSLFLFCGKHRDRMKVLLWEGDGFVLLYKRLDNGSFKWPKSEKQARALSQTELRWLLEGLKIDQPKAIKQGHSGDLY